MRLQVTVTVGIGPVNTGMVGMAIVVVRIDVVAVVVVVWLVAGNVLVAVGCVLDVIGVVLVAAELEHPDTIQVKMISIDINTNIVPRLNSVLSHIFPSPSHRHYSILSSIIL